MSDVTVTRFVVDPVNTNHTLTTPEAFGDFVIGDTASVIRDEKPVCFATVEDIITRESNGTRQLVLSGINRRTVKPTDSLRSMQNAPSRFATATPQGFAG